MNAAARILCLACAAVSLHAQWVSMFDGGTLDGWKEAPFAGRGSVSVRSGVLTLGTGRMTGIAWTRDFPRVDYELRFEAARIEGNDFFAAVVFPVEDSWCSWISGGWDGTVVGLSNYDDDDASENITSTVHEFVRERWYDFRLVVTGGRIQAWINGSPVIDAETAGHTVALRFDDTDLCKPLGFASYRTTGALRNIRYRKLPAGEHP